MDGDIRKIIRVDRDAFYASVERRDGPSRPGRPVIVGLAVAALLSSCAQPDRGRCLASHLEKHYQPTDVFLGGFAGYTHEYIPSDDPVCDRWEYPNGRPASSGHPE